MEHHYTLTVSCPDQVGIVSTVSQYIAEKGGWILEANHHSDHQSQWFFMRYEIRVSSLSVDLPTFKMDFEKLAKRFSMTWKINDSRQPKSVLILAGRQSHCLHELLHAWKDSHLPCHISAVASNHDAVKKMADWYETPFHHIPITDGDKDAHFLQLEELIEQLQPEVIVLARYMQILPPMLCKKYPEKIINIHHGFLPSFIGAKPYHQAAQKGVKLVGATCHYVTSELDSGPIIEQDVIRINHSHQVEDMIRLGQDVEKRVLSRGLLLHLEDRIIVHDHKTVVFE